MLWTLGQGVLEKSAICKVLEKYQFCMDLKLCTVL